MIKNKKNPSELAIIHHKAMDDWVEERLIFSSAT